ncbi:hypothetical protein J6590_078359 [Homalodisca vitripennis]|nr:hypothetical protein J6590_078359 [Homalodisca vitripennis]
MAVKHDMELYAVLDCIREKQYVRNSHQFIIQTPQLLGEPGCANFDSRYLCQSEIYYFFDYYNSLATLNSIISSFIQSSRSDSQAISLSRPPPSPVTIVELKAEGYWDELDRRQPNCLTKARPTAPPITAEHFPFRRRQRCHVSSVVAVIR